MPDLSPAPTIELDRLDDGARAALFTEAKTAYSFADVPVTDEQLASIWDLAKWPPSSANFQPLRVLYVRTAEGRENLAAHMNDNNKARVLGAPVVAVLAFDRGFHAHLSTTTPHLAHYTEFFEQNEGPRLDSARNNSWLQAGYFLLAVRAEGLAAGPMGGFNAATLDEQFFPEGDWGSFLVATIGHPTEASYRDRLPRLDTDVVVRWA
ncbi:MAG: 3-hydroxypropanoate dehydrogenase [Actinomycetota bacterium]|jgi:3-hydroxypropanoate dehydrogenase|nr:3-hydroxypropanoate dehydrogenase [Actinomycetota bacterium]